ncbi:MAG: DNA primase DnaG [Candidatus Thalassarchaeaceae archaeon]|nr:DNA primase DnaG [Candidatus Thalassarchaeaceae archaeon]
MSDQKAKYMIHATIKADGTIQRKDVVGAIFGQTEGLLGEELQLRKLQRTGRIGHVDVDLKSNKGKVSGEILLPSSLDQVSTAVIGAALETIERIGPCKATIKVATIENIHSVKRDTVIDRAKDLLLGIVNEGSNDSKSILDEVRSVLTLGTETNISGMTCGPNAADSDALIIVEGRNDVRNLLKFGIKNSIATMGANVKDELVALAKGKSNVTAFCDGDRGGKLLLMELSGALGKSLTHVAIAPESREVEHLEGKVVTKCLNQKEAASKAINRIKAQLEADDSGQRPAKAGASNGSVEVPDNIREWSAHMGDLKKNYALLILEDGSASEQIGASKLADFAADVEGAQCLIVNSKISARMVEIAEVGAIPSVLGSASGVGSSDSVEAYSMSDLE